MSEELLVRHCAPTLAGLKTGNLFTCTYNSREEVMTSVRTLNGLLNPKGICVMPLRFREKHVLIYVFRPKRLSGDLAGGQARRMLAELGYAVEKPAACLRRLMARLDNSGAFPHEIGLFLGYPPEDVAGFIENGAADYKCVGTWKVYGDVERARNEFARFKKCSRVYYDQWKQGKSIERLAVAV